MNIRKLHIKGYKSVANMTLRDVAGAAGVSLGYLSEVERGLKEPSSEILECILDSLGISIRDLLVEVLEVC